MWAEVFLRATQNSWCTTSTRITPSNAGFSQIFTTLVLATAVLVSKEKSFQPGGEFPGLFPTWICNMVLLITFCSWRLVGGNAFSDCSHGQVVPSLPELKKHLGSALRHLVAFLGLSYAGPGAGLTAPCVSLPAQDILLFQVGRTLCQ